MSKEEVLSVSKAGFYQANQSNLRSYNAFKKLWLVGKKPAFQKCHFFGDRLTVSIKLEHYF